jgi:hypothetical protein
MSRRTEIAEELSSLVAGPRPVADSAIPPLVFVVVNAAWGLAPAAVVAVVAALAFTAWRVTRGVAIGYALAGIGGVLVAVVLALYSGRAELYFLPGILSGAAWTVALVASILVRRPLTAWSSWALRGWPLDWFWRNDVRPAYSEVAWLWAGFFAARSLVQWVFFDQGASGALAVIRIVTGWPSLALLLIASYSYGSWRLPRLGGPSVAEFRGGAEPPFESQRRGF